MALFGDGTKYGTGALYGATLIRGTVGAQSSLTGSLLRIKQVSGSVNAQSSVSGQAYNNLQQISGQIVGDSVVTGLARTYQRVRFYFPSTGGAPISPAISSTWDTAIPSYHGWIRGTCKPYPQSTSFVIPHTLFPDSKVAFVQYISDKLAAQTITGKVRGFLQARETSASYDSCPAVIIRVVSENGSVVRGTLLSSVPASLQDEFFANSSVLKNNYFPREQDVSEITCQENDRIVIEIGRKSFYGSYAYNYLKFGDNAGSDLPENNTETTELNPWIEFDSPLYFASQKFAAGQISGISTLNAALTAYKMLSGVIASQSSLAANVLRVKLINGSFGGQSDLNVIAKNSLKAIGDIAALTVLIGDAHIFISAIGEVNAQSSLVVSPHTALQAAGSISGLSSLSARLLRILAVQGDLAVQSAISGIIIKSIPVQGLISIQSLLSGATKVNKGSIGHIIAHSLLSSTAKRNLPIRGLIHGKAAVYARAICPTRLIQGSINSASNISTLFPHLIRGVEGIISPASSLTGSMRADWRAKALLQPESNVYAAPRMSYGASGAINSVSNLRAYPYYIISPFTGEIVMFFEVYDLHDIVITDDSHLIRVDALSDLYEMEVKDDGCLILVEEDKYDIKTRWRL